MITCDLGLQATGNIAVCWIVFSGGIIAVLPVAVLWFNEVNQMGA
jgi:hypothetical protein